MKFGVTLRNMGPQSSLETLLSCARAADDCGLESLWITDHIAIPPDDAEGSGGRYLDPLITLSFIAGATGSIKLGTGVLILPYRPALPTAKQVATLQELSGERLLLGVGIGWMDAEFRALGIDRHQRGRTSDECLAFLHRCFENDVVAANGQEFLFKPNPQRPPIYIGGRAPHALKRAARFGDGWLPMGGEPDRLATDIAEYHRLCAEAGRPAGGVSLMRALPLNDPALCSELIAAYQAIGVNRLVCAIGYDNAAEYKTELSKLTDHL
jgi:probable F420-dependent oxidoreductase